MIKYLITLLIGISANLVPLKAIAAEIITFDFPPFGQFYIQIDDLRTFVNTGKISNELAYYLNRLPPQQVDKLPELLSTPLEFNALTIANFSNSTIGATVIKNFGKGIRTNTNKNGFLALRGAIIAAAFDRNGLTIMNILNQFPLKDIYIDTKIIDLYLQQGNKIFKDRKIIDEFWFNDLENQPQTEIVANPQLHQTGNYSWQKSTLTYNNPYRSKLGYFDLYIPAKKQSSLVIISHGVASSRQTFAYLGEHLASHGFAVAIVEHDDISLDKFDGFLAGLEDFPKPNNLIYQPLDIKYVLDTLEQNLLADSELTEQINLQQVGIMGHSFGGYTSLALAGARLLADPQAKSCQTEDYTAVLLNLSALAKCTFNQIAVEEFQLKDDRIKAVLAINPMGRIFDSQGIGYIDIPTMLISSTNDIIMPPVAEQIQPFSWLNQNLDKYLVLVKPGTHFSFLREGLGVLPVPDNVVGISPTEAYPVIKTLATVFFQAHLNQQPKYQAYLLNSCQINCNYRFKIMENNSFQLSIINSLNQIQLQKLLESN